MSLLSLSNTHITSSVVIKIGGALLTHREHLLAVFQQIAQLQQQGVAVVLVHGGGSSVDEQLSAQGLISEKFQGQRITPQAHIPVVSGALAGHVNKQLVAVAASAGICAVGISLADADLVAVTPVPALKQVATTTPKNPQLLQLLTSANFLPIISSIAAKNGDLFNVNADIAAATVAQLVEADLIVLSDTPGVLDQQGQLLPTLTNAEITSLVQQGVIQGGMQVKVDAALHAAKTLRRCVSILDWHDVSAIKHWHLGKNVGTKIQPE